MDPKAERRVDQKMPEGALQTYTRLLGYVRPYWKAFVVAALCMVFTAATESTFPAVMSFLLDKGFQAPSPEMVWMIPLGLVALFFVRGIAVFCSGYVMSWITSNVVMTLRREMFAKLLRLPARYYADHVLPEAALYAAGVTQGAGSVLALDEEGF